MCLKNRGVKKKIFAFFLGILLVFVLLELALRLIPHSTEIKDEIADKSVYKILCLGNSYTAGSGADTADGTYPRQLEKSLIEKYPQQKIKVINGGIISLNTRALLNELDNMIERVKPQLILLQIGSANYTNRFGYLTSMRSTPFFKFLLWEINEGLSALKTYKLVFEFLGQKEKKERRTFSEEIRDSMLYSDLAERRSLNHTEKIKEEEINIADAPVHVERLKRYLDKIETFETSWIFLAMAKIQRYVFKDYKSATDNYIKSFETTIFPSEFDDIVRGMRGLMNENGFPQEEKEKIEKFFKLQEFKNPDPFSTIMALSDKEIETWIEQDLELMIKKIHHKKIRLVLLNYHPMLDGELLKLNNIIRRKANEHNIPLVDVASRFRQIFSERAQQKDYYWLFLGRLDDHLNNRGYKVVSDQVFDVLLKENVLPFGGTPYVAK